MMKFITEEYLRDLYKKEPFSIYELNQGERLTPGAREYLSDRGIKMLDEVSCKNNSIPEVKQCRVESLLSSMPRRLSAVPYYASSNPYSR